MVIDRQRVAMTAARAIAVLLIMMATSGAGSPVTGLGSVALPLQTGPNGEVVVYPTGLYPGDVQEVYAAVNGGIGPSGTAYAGGGTILLKARDRNGVLAYFNFGNDLTGRGGVQILTDVVIAGESFDPPETPLSFPNTSAVPGVPTLTPDAYLVDGTPTTPDRTVIYGGAVVFGRAMTDPAPWAAPRLAVRNIYFAYPAGAAVRVKQCSGLEVSRCVIYDLTRRAVAGVPGFFVATGIEATGLFVIDEGSPNPYLYGDYTVFDNVMKRRTEYSCGGGSSYVPDSYGFADSGIVVQIASMNATITNNRVYNFPFVGIGIDSNTRASKIADNRIFNCGFGGYVLPSSCVLTYAVPAGHVGARRNSAPLLIEHNEITGGFDGSGALTSANGLSFAAVSNAIVRANTVKGLVLDSGLFVLGLDWVTSSDNSFSANDLRGLQAGLSQVFLDAGSDRNEFANNDYGPVGPQGMAGAWIRNCHDNTFTNENFWGDYPGIFVADPLPCMMFSQGSSGNTVSALKDGQALQGFDVCAQILDAASPAFTPLNFINGYERCTNVPQFVINWMLVKDAEFIDRQKQRCAGSGGTWDEATQTCTHK